MKFAHYMHIERLGREEVDGLIDGTVYVFPKLDGCNASVWMEDGQIACGSRNRKVGCAGTCTWRGLPEYVAASEGIKNFLVKYPHFRLHGEWLVPHTLKSYHQDAWNHLYVFDVSIDKDGLDAIEYIPYDVYEPWLKQYSITYIPCAATVEHGTAEIFQKLVAENHYLLDQDKIGEGIVLKRYDFVNKWNRTTWAKIVHADFARKHGGSNSQTVTKDGKCVEQLIVDTYVTPDFVEKEYSRLCAGMSELWTSKMIPALLGVVYHALITEELWSALKKFKAHQVIDFRLLNKLTIEKIKEIKKGLF